MVNYLDDDQTQPSRDLGNLSQRQNEVLTIAYDVLAGCNTALTKPQWLDLFREKWSSPEVVGLFMFAVDTLVNYGMVHSEPANQSHNDREYFVKRP